ncbi:hypothetical protein [Companilactobacillus furfuricola]|uniref:hypothetical protein n=1 Tax=Companilactobacillus furfuricola TaxID=1462575 RepID=UPI000F78D6DF|nr:hypothetical protein [Companilactobacillus furfuricola]
MSIFEIKLDDHKAKRYIAQPVWIRQADTPDKLRVILGDGLTVDSTTQFEFDATKFDNQLIQDKEQSHFELYKDSNGDSVGFTYQLPLELYQSSGSTTATYFRINGSSTSNFIIYVQRADGIGESNSLISGANEILTQMSSTYESLQEVLANANIDSEDITAKIESLKADLQAIEKLIDDNNVIKKSEAEEIITGIVNAMDLPTDDTISDPDVLAKIQTLGAV